MNAARIRNGIVVNVEVHNAASVALSEMTRGGDTLVPYGDDEAVFIGLAYSEPLGFHQALADGEKAAPDTNTDPT